MIVLGQRVRHRLMRDVVGTVTHLYPAGQHTIMVVLRLDTGGHAAFNEDDIEPL